MNQLGKTRTEQDTENLESTTGERPDALRLYLTEIGKIPLITVDEENALAARIKLGDAEAREHMIKANLRLVVKIARDYDGMGVPLLDLINEGNIGLMKAVARFDPSKGAKLSTYAAWWIKQAMRRALDNQSRTIRLPNHVNDRLSKLRTLEFRLRDEFDREPSEEEISELSGLSIKKIRQYRDASRTMVSLNAPTGKDDSGIVLERIPDAQAKGPPQTLSEQEENNLVMEFMDLLKPREQMILTRRFGLDGGEPQSLEEVGATLGLTRERIRQIQQASLAKMRAAMERRHRTPVVGEKALAA